MTELFLEEKLVKKWLLREGVSVRRPDGTIESDWAVLYISIHRVIACNKNGTVRKKMPILEFLELNWDG